jgi:hypothetical protein
MPELYVATRKLAGNGDEKMTDSGGKKKEAPTTRHQIQRNKNERKMTGKKRARERERERERGKCKKH